MSQGRPRVFLADDHRIVTEALTLLLRDEFDVAGTFANGRNVVAAVDCQPVDAVILDVTMPGMNGFEAARRISAKHPEVVIVFLSVHTGRPYVEEAFRIGAKAYVSKPRAATELAAAIRSALSGVRYVSRSAWQPPVPQESR
ncbi:MAG: response regulator transcription factor [Bryobacteraceae bacterium]|nr:response regulator transcription factor [Bryobacteraceae bacterium]